MILVLYAVFGALVQPTVIHLLRMCIAHVAEMSTNNDTLIPTRNPQLEASITNGNTNGECHKPDARTHGDLAS